MRRAFFKIKKMKKDTVKALSVGGLGKNIYKHGDVVNSDNFGGESQAMALVKQGFFVK